MGHYFQEYNDIVKPSKGITRKLPTTTETRRQTEGGDISSYFTESTESSLPAQW